ncbi:MAG: hypothetical protein ACE5FN_04550 [Leptospirillia bacterium]
MPDRGELIQPRASHLISIGLIAAWLMLTVPAWGAEAAPDPSDTSGEVHITVLASPDTNGENRRLARELRRALKKARYLTGRFSVRIMQVSRLPAAAPAPLPASLRKATTGDTFVIWSSIDDAGRPTLSIAHRYAFEPAFQSRQAAGERPIVPVLHRLPAFDAQNPVQAVYAVLGLAYLRLDRFDAAHQVLVALNNYPDLPAMERYPVVFFIALSELGMGLSRSDGALVDSALYHFGALTTVMGKDDDLRVLGATLFNRGLAYQAHPERKGAAVLTKAVNSLEAALPFFRADDVPVLHARLLHHIATLEMRMPTGDTGKHLHRAIMAYRRALRIWTPEAFPEAYRTALHNSAVCLQRLPDGDRNKNLLAAIKLYQEAIRVPGLESRPDLIAISYGNMGQAYQALPTLPDGANLWAAIAAYRDALRYWTVEVNPRQYARMHQFTAEALYNMPGADRRGYMLRAVGHYDRAISVLTAEAAPMDHALLQIKKGIVLTTLPGPGTRRALTLARDAFETALTIITPDNLPYWHGQVVKKLEQVDHRLRLLGVDPSLNRDAPKTPQMPRKEE